MSQQLSGVPKAVVNVSDNSLVFNRESSSIYCLQGPTARGKINNLYYIRNSTEFVRKLGGRIEGSEFPLYCMRVLDAGAKLWISPAGHFTSVTDKSSVVGDKGVARIGDGGAAETLATALVTITDEGDDTNVFVISHNGNTIATYAVETGDTLADVVTALGLSGQSNTFGYRIVSVNTGTGEINIEGPIGSGATINTTSLVVSVTGAGTGAGTAGSFSGGVTAIENAVYYVAEEVGGGYNGTTITHVAASSGKTGFFDIQVLAAGSDNVITVKDFPLTPTLADITKANNKLEFVKISYVFNNVVLGSGIIAGGDKDISLITSTDYNGNSVAKTGWWSFGKVTNAFRIANIAKADPLVDLGLAQYVSSREDMRFHIASPIGFTPSMVKDYRLGEGDYSHNAIDDWKGSLWAGQTNITDPNDSTVNFDIPGLVEYLCLRSSVDSDPNYGVWWSAAGLKRGLVKFPNNGVGDVNFLSPEFSDESDEAFTAGVNAICEDETYGTVAWGNKSLMLDRSKLLNAENIADLAMYIKRRLAVIARVELFEPNDPIMWRELYRRVLPFITKELEAGRAIVPGEGKGWAWIGDQDANTALDAKFNTQEDITARKYKARFVFIPIGATEFIGIDVVPTDSGTFTTIVV